MQRYDRLVTLYCVVYRINTSSHESKNKVCSKASLFVYYCWWLISGFCTIKRLGVHCIAILLLVAMYQIS